MVPLIGATLLFQYVMDRNYSGAFHTVPRDVAEAADAASPVLNQDGQLPFPFPQAFQAPCMYDDAALDPDRLLTESEKHVYRDVVSASFRQDPRQDGCRYHRAHCSARPEGSSWSLRLLCRGTI